MTGAIRPFTLRRAGRRLGLVEVGVATPEHLRTVSAMRDIVDETVAAEDADGWLSPTFPIDATRVARGPGGCLYRIDPPSEVRLVEDAEVELSTGGRRMAGRLGPVADESCLVETAWDLGPRVVPARLSVDGAAPLRKLGDRLAALAEVAAPAARSSSAAERPVFRFDQAALVLGSPG